MTIAADLRRGIAQLDREFRAGGMWSRCEHHPWPAGRPVGDDGLPVLAPPVELLALIEDGERETIAPDGNAIPSSARLTVARSTTIGRDDRIALPGDLQPRTVIRVDDTRDARGTLYQLVWLA